MGVHYLRNENGGVTSVDDEHLETRLLITTASGRTYLPPGWEELDEATARKENPQLFGAVDPYVEIGKTGLELASEIKRREMLDTLRVD